MSLIVAKNIRNRVTIVGDTKLTYPIDRYDVANSSQTRSPSLPRDGVIKITLTKPQICLSFAGDVDPAEQAVSQVRELGYNVDKILSLLKNINKESENNTQFILAISFPLYKIFEIKNYQCIETKNSWIGSQRGFNVFQTKFLENKNQAKDEKSKMSSALDAVINDSGVDEVNGFKIQVNCNGECFEYQAYMQSYLANKTYKFKLPAGTNSAIIPITHGSAADGGYTVNVFLNRNNIDYLAIHILQGEFGIVYKSNGGLMWPELIMKNELDFVDYVGNQYRLTPMEITTQRDTSNQPKILQLLSQRRK